MTDDALTDVEDIELHPKKKEVVEAPNPLYDTASPDDDDGIINFTQSMRINILRELAPNAAAPKNYKNNRLVADLLRDTSATAQSRITARKDRTGVSPELIAALAAQIQYNQPVAGAVEREPPSYDRPLSNRPVTPEVVTTTEHKETYSEFDDRTKNIDVTDSDQ